MHFYSNVYGRVSQVIAPEEIIDPSVDEQSVMTYLSQFPKAKLKPGAPLKPKLNPKKARAYGPGTPLVPPQSAPNRNTQPLIVFNCLPLIKACVKPTGPQYITVYMKITINTGELCKVFNQLRRPHRDLDISVQKVLLHPSQVGLLQTGASDTL